MEEPQLPIIKYEDWDKDKADIIFKDFLKQREAWLKYQESKTGKSIAVLKLKQLIEKADKRDHLLIDERFNMIINLTKEMKK